jgi:hypothetical protein
MQTPKKPDGDGDAEAEADAGGDAVSIVTA